MLQASHRGLVDEKAAELKAEMCPDRQAKAAQLGPVLPASAPEA